MLELASKFHQAFSKLKGTNKDFTLTQGHVKQFRGKGIPLYVGTKIAKMYNQLFQLPFLIHPQCAVYAIPERQKEDGRK